MLRSLRDPSQRALFRYAQASAGYQRGLAIGKTGPKPRDPNRVRGDTDYVKRRRVYRHILHDQRVEFQNEVSSAPTNATSRDSSVDPERQAAKEARLAEKRAKSEARQERHKELLEEIQKTKQVRVAYRKKEWEMKQKAVAARRAGDLQLLIEHADEWVTEDNLDDHVERALDQFFFNEEQKKEVKIEGWQ